MNGNIKLSQSPVTNFVSLAVFFLILSTIACVVGGGGSESTDCVNISVDSFEAKDGHVAVDNTITYNCDKHIKLILFKTICVTPSGEVFVDDRGSVFIHYNFNDSKHDGIENYKTVMETNSYQVDACYSEITEVDFEYR